MTIEVLGTGCPKCKRLEEMTRTAAARLGIACDVVHVREIAEIVRRGVMATPALVIDGAVVVSGRLPREEELVAWLKRVPAGE